MQQNETDADYFRRRAEQEVELAQSATEPAVVSAHYRMAELYLERVASLAPEEVPSGD